MLSAILDHNFTLYVTSQTELRLLKYSYMAKISKDKNIAWPYLWRFCQGIINYPLPIVNPEEPNVTLLPVSLPGLN